MKRNRVLQGVLALPALLWYGLIWSFSAQPATQSGQMSDGLLHRLLLAVSPSYGAAGREVQVAAMEILSFYERKAAHMLLYFILALLLWLAVQFWTKGGLRWGLPLALCGVLAALDEYHQTLVPGRSGELRDVLVDLAGGVVAMLLLAVFLRGVRFRGGRRFRPGPFWLVPAALTVLAFFVFWRDLGLLPPFAFRALNGGIELFAPLDMEQRLELLRAASPVLRESLALAGCTLVGFCGGAAVLLSGVRRVFAPVLALAVVPPVLLCGVGGLSLGLSLGFSLLGATLVLLAWGACDVLARWLEYSGARPI